MILAICRQTVGRTTARQHLTKRNKQTKPLPEPAVGDGRGFEHRAENRSVAEKIFSKVLLFAHYAIRHLGGDLPVPLLVPIAESFFQFAVKKNVSIAAKIVTKRCVLTKAMTKQSEEIH